jgi:hypothetical protein
VILLFFATQNEHQQPKNDCCPFLPLVSQSVT